jgi:DNA-binding response OmpR family regulator
MRGPRILLVEDEADIRELIRMRLEREGYAVTEAGDGEVALRLLKGGEPFDLHLFDWMLPRMSGLELTRTLRAAPLASRAPVLMVTARNEAADVVAGLEAGADDYVTKPFEIPVLLARVRALLRRASLATAGRAGGPTEGGVLELGALRLDLGTYEVRCGAESVSLTPSEFKLLAALLQNQGRVLTRQQLIDLVQGVGVSVVDRAVDTHVFGLRKKLGACGDLIETVRGVGYRVRTG